MKRLLIVLFVLWSVPSYAALNGPEAESARNARDAAIYATRATLVADPDLLAYLIRAQRDTGALYFALIGGYPQDEARDIQMRDALWFHDRALNVTLPDAAKAIAEARELKAQDVRLGMAAAYIDWAMEHLRRVDRTLAYADPTPQALLFGQTVPAVIGPHGGYYRTVTQGFWSTHYWRDWLSDGAIPLLRAKPEKKAQFREALLAYVAGVEMQYKAAGRFAALEATHDQFCSVLEGARLLWDAVGVTNPGVPAQYHSLMRAWALIVTDDPAAQRSLMVLTDSWQRSDATMGGALGFFNPAQKARCGL